MKLSQLMQGIPYVILQEAERVENIEIHSISCDSHEVKEGDVFVCIEGAKKDGHDYMEDAAVAGAAVCIVEKRRKNHSKLCFSAWITVLLVTDTRSAYSKMSATYFGNPADKLKLIGVTGTKGKTMVTHMITELLNASGHPAGRIGTLGVRIGDMDFSTKNTTPDAFTIQKYFAKMVEMGCEYAVLEVSSQSMKQRRLEGLTFEAAIFTNFSPDHIGEGEHKNIKEYRYYKSRLFKQTKYAIGNVDDIACSYMFRQTECQKFGFSCCDKGNILKYGLILRAGNIRYRMDEEGPFTLFEVNGRQYKLRSPGIFNVYNALAAIQTLCALKIEDKNWRESISCVKIDGRMQRVFTDKKIACYVDYAHNATSLQEILTTMRRYHPKRLIVVFGCGGNRAKLRRTQMGEVAGTYADFTILTSDNPRFEEPKLIIKDIVSGMKKTKGKYQIIIDREMAVQYALDMAKEGDIVIVAGKGHETYQEIKGICYPMSDQELIQKYGRNREGTIDVRRDYC